MVEKMKFVNIMGRIEDIDRVIIKYISKYEIQLENAVTELSNEKNVKPLNQNNEYAAVLKDAQNLVDILGEKSEFSETEMSPKDAVEFINNMTNLLSQHEDEKKELLDKKVKLQEMQEQIEPFRNLDFELEKLFKFEFINYRFGRMPKESYKKLESYSNATDTSFFVQSYSDPEYVWGIFFSIKGNDEKFALLLSSLHFEKKFISAELTGTPAQAYFSLTEKINRIDEEIKEIDRSRAKELSTCKEHIFEAYKVIDDMNNTFIVKKYAAYIHKYMFDEFVIVGWMTKEDALKLEMEINKDEKVVFIAEDNHESIKSKAPTKLKNPKLFKPFEMFVKMYGVPSYNGFDPTIFVAVTYAFIFGMMFGDVGQGLILLIGGAILYKTKKMNLAAIISLAGIFSTLFGFAYGSVFGYEEAIPTMWLKPMEETMTVLIVAVAFGVLLIVTAMIINIICKAKQGKFGEALFDTNGVSGLVFYVAVIAAVLLIMFGNVEIGAGILVIFIGIPLLLTAFKEPIIRFMEHKKNLIPGSKGEYFMETFFEMFEVLLSYVTNTISFVRIGAFALSHAGMMSVVHMLAGNDNILILVLGNLLVMGLEGLVVGIQVLRLEYYEMFSRFYEADGVEFEPNTH